MSIIEVKTLKENRISINSKNIIYHRENPSQLVLKLERHDNCVGITLTAVYKEGNRYCDLGDFYALVSFASKKEIENLAEKVEKNAKKFHKETLDILVKGNYRLYLPDNGEMDLLVDGKPWRVPDNLASISS